MGPVWDVVPNNALFVHSCDYWSLLVNDIPMITTWGNAYLSQLFQLKIEHFILLKRKELLILDSNVWYFRKYLTTKIVLEA